MIFKINNIVIRPPQPSQIYEFHRNCRCSDYTLSKNTVLNIFYFSYNKKYILSIDF